MMETMPNAQHEPRGFYDFTGVTYLLPFTLRRLVASMILSNVFACAMLGTRRCPR